MTTTKTTEDLALAVMRRLGLVDINKQPTAAQLAHISDVYQDKLEELIPRDKIYWSTDAIPRAVFGAMTRIVAEEVAPTFSKPVPTEQDENGQAMSIGNRGLMMLKRHMARDTTGLPTQAQYF